MTKHAPCLLALLLLLVLPASAQPADLLDLIEPDVWTVQEARIDTVSGNEWRLLTHDTTDATAELVYDTSGAVVALVAIYTDSLFAYSPAFLPAFPQVPTDPQGVYDILTAPPGGLADDVWGTAAILRITYERGQ